MTRAEFQDWAQQLKAGDSSFIIFLLTAHGRQCERYLIKKYRCAPTEAEDILMDIILDLREKILREKIDHLDNPGGYLLKACEKSYWNRVKIRQKQAGKSDDILYYFYQERYDEGQLKKLIESELQQEIEQEKQKKIKLVINALNTLQAKCRQILRLFYVERKSMDAIADLMGFANKDVAKASKYRCFNKWRAKVEAHLTIKN